MLIEVFRQVSLSKNPRVTFGKLYVNNKLFTNTLEDVERTEKVYGKTAIPKGKYQIKLRTEGTKTLKYAKVFPDIHKGMLWLQNVPNYEYVYIHTGTTELDTLGCILVGDTIISKQQMIIDSRIAYKRLYKVIIEAMNKGEEVWIDIK